MQGEGEPSELYLPKTRKQPCQKGGPWLGLDQVAARPYDAFSRLCACQRAEDQAVFRKSFYCFPWKNHLAVSQDSGPLVPQQITGKLEWVSEWLWALFVFRRGSRVVISGGKLGRKTVWHEYSHRWQTFLAGPHSRAQYPGIPTSLRREAPVSPLISHTLLSLGTVPQFYSVIVRQLKDRRLRVVILVPKARFKEWRQNIVLSGFFVLPSHLKGRRDPLWDLSPLWFSVPPAAATSATKKLLTVLSFSLLPSTDSFSELTHTKHNFCLLLGLQNFSDIWFLSSTHYFTSFQSTPTTEGPHSFLILDATAPCQFSVLLTTRQHMLPLGPYHLADRKPLFP